MAAMPDVPRDAAAAAIAAAKPQTTAKRCKGEDKFLALALLKKKFPARNLTGTGARDRFENKIYRLLTFLSFSPNLIHIFWPRDIRVSL
jgi:hypothetical protein